MPESLKSFIFNEVFKRGLDWWKYGAINERVEKCLTTHGAITVSEVLNIIDNVYGCNLMFDYTIDESVKWC